MSASERPANTADRHPAQWLALAIGIVYTLVGIAGFFVTGFDGFVSPDGELLMGFEVNPLHNIVHLAIGVLGLVMWGRRDTAQGYGWILAVAYLPTFLYGLAVAGSDQPANFLALNTADNWLHLVSAVAGVAIAAWLMRDRKAEAGHPATGRAT